jgi:hypothetical protein
MIELFGNFIPRFPYKELRAKSISRTVGAPVRESETKSKQRSNMDLQDFVTTTLCQISAGVATAKNYDRCVAPRVDVGERDPKILRTFAGADGVFLVEFDVAVTISDASENGATASIMVLSPPAPKLKTKGGIENSSVNRLKFTVPIAYR